LNEQDLKRRVQKLRERVALDDGPEALMAETLLNKILSQHSLPEDFGTQVVRRPVKIHAGMNRVAKYVAWAFKLDVYVNKGSGKISVEGCERDVELFEWALDDLKTIYNNMYAKAMLKLKSHMIGMAESMFNLDPPKCPKCGGELVVRERRWHCTCGYISKKMRSVDVDFDAYVKGSSESKLQIGHKK